MSRQAIFVLTLTVLGLAGVGVWLLTFEHQPVTAGFSFDQIDPQVSADFADRLGGLLTRDDVARIEAIARQELASAYAGLCLPISDSHASTYHVRVQQELVGLIAGGSRSVPGVGGHGDISFSAIASSAVAFAPAGASRDTIIEAIGRGIGRTAAHELAHQVVGAMDIHDKRDRLSYEYPDLRPEHFYAPLHWTLAAKPLEAHLGRCG